MYAVAAGRTTQQANNTCNVWLQTVASAGTGGRKRHSASPLSQALFTRILPLGVVQLVICATRAEYSASETGLDHLYSNSPEKLAEVKAEFTGMSDHKIISVRKFSKDMKRTDRYTTKRMFKSFHPDQFQAAVRSMPELEDYLATPCPSTAATILANGLTRILNNMAPVKTIQNRKNLYPTSLLE